MNGRENVRGELLILKKICDLPFGRQVKSLTDLLKCFKTSIVQYQRGPRFGNGSAAT